MPLKMYTGMKKSVLNKYKKQQESDKKVNFSLNQNEIIAETHRTNKLMTNVFINQFEQKKNKKKLDKIYRGKFKSKSKFKDGTLKLSKKFFKNMKKQQ